MHTVTRDFSTSFRIKSSKFLGYLLPCASEVEKDLGLERIRAEHPLATHHCYGYIYNPANPVFYSSDDGEPSGTAGQPILNVLQSADLMNVLMIAVRYYGGTKLGKAGLIEAYSEIARQTTDIADLKNIIPVQIYRVVYEYNQQSLIDQLHHNIDLITLDAQYTEKVDLTLACPVPAKDQFHFYIEKFSHLLEHFEILETSWHVF